MKGGYVPQLRQNIITGEWVVIAPERAKRPNDYVTADTVKVQSKTDCNFCEGRNAFNERIKKYDTPNIYISPNKFPAFFELKDHCSPKSYKLEDEFYRARPSSGGHDIVVIKDHDLDLPHFTKTIWIDLLEAFKKRYIYFKEKCATYTMPIYNHGREAGASVEHPHAQIFASNIIPNIISTELHHSEKYYEHNGSCVFCDLIKHEKEFKKRVLFENKDFIAFTFYAARFPFEVWIMPKNHECSFENQSNESYKLLSDALIDVFNRLNSTLNDPPLNFFIHNLPNTVKETQHYHWHIEVAPRITGYGGYEMGSGIIIDVFSPEIAAKFLINANKK